MYKLLFIREDRNFFLPEIIFKEFQVEVVEEDKKKLGNIIFQFKPQIIVTEESVSFKTIKYLSLKYSFLPICCLGNFEEQKKLEKLLELGANIFKLPLSEQEILNNIKNIAWSSLAKEDIWDSEYELCLKEKRHELINYLLKITGLFFLFIFLVFISSKFYKQYFAPKSFFEEVEFQYINPSDITTADEKYLINDWTVRNIFEYSQKDDKIVGMLVPDKKFNSICFEPSNKYLAASSFEENTIYLYKYPDFSNIISSFTIKDAVILSLYAEGQNIFVLTNSNIFYNFEIDSGKFKLLNSYKIRDFLPIDVSIYNNNLYFLSEDNKIYIAKIENNEINIKKVIIISDYFDGKFKLTSVAIGLDYFYLLSEKNKKLFKLPKKILA